MTSAQIVEAKADKRLWDWVVMRDPFGLPMPPTPPTLNQREPLRVDPRAGPGDVVTPTVL